MFTETNEQKFSLGGVRELEDLQSSRKRFGLKHREGDLCWSRSESDSDNRQTFFSSRVVAILSSLTAAVVFCPDVAVCNEYK